MATTTQGLVRFAPDDVDGIANYYREHGYVVVRRAIPDELIQGVLSAFRRLKRVPYYVFYSQDTNRLERLKTNREGFLEHSILNPKDLYCSQGLATAVERLVTAGFSANYLQKLSGRLEHTVWQTMLFDKSTGTRAHQDHYYLDSKPAGHMVAAWYALEDVFADTGAFFVAPGSHRGRVLERQDTSKNDHERFVDEIREIITTGDYTLKPCLVERGDVIYWHPFTIHGAFKNENPFLSRKSITAHYLPEGYQLNTRSMPERTRSKHNPAFKVWKRDRADPLRFFKWQCAYARDRLLRRGTPKHETRGDLEVE